MEVVNIKQSIKIGVKPSHLWKQGNFWIFFNDKIYDSNKNNDRCNYMNLQNGLEENTAMTAF